MSETDIEPKRDQSPPELPLRGDQMMSETGLDPLRKHGFQPDHHRNWFLKEHFPSWLQAFSSMVLLLVTSYYAYLTHGLLKVQVEPAVAFDLIEEHGGPKIVVSNRGVYPVVNVSIDVRLETNQPSPSNRMVYGMPLGTPGAPLPSFWFIEKLAPRMSQSRSAVDVAKRALEVWGEVRAGVVREESTGRDGKISSLKRQDPGESDTLSELEGEGFAESLVAVKFRVRFFREVDLKEYSFYRQFSYFPPGEAKAFSFFPASSRDDF